MSLSCNEFTGHCQCRPGFGGQTCTDCQENYWGNPSIHCRACDCDPRGIETSQCNRINGHCSCRQGVSGVRCDQCARGFTGQFPDCQPCHKCFGDWDRIVQDLIAQTKQLVQHAKEVQLTGITGAFEKNFRDLEEKLAEAQAIVKERNATTEAVNSLMKLIDELRTKIAETTDTLTKLEGDLTAVQDKNSGAINDLNTLEREARALNLSAKELSHHLDVLKNSNFLGAYDSIQKSYEQSREAERKANDSTVATRSIVAQSASTRAKTEQLMSEKKNEFNRANAANRRALNDLSARVNLLDIKTVNEKVCGAPGDLPCAESPCGGAGCHKDDGGRHCGGLNCNGAVATADNALGRAQHAESDLYKALRDVGELFEKVAKAKVKADEAKQKALAALEKANDTKARVERSNKELQALIKQIREFLTQEGADPNSIEMVASRVLELTIPASPEQIRHLAEEIKDRVSSLSDVDAILDQTADDVRRAEQLLLDARKAKTRAENVKNTAESVKKALEDASSAQTAAETAIQQAEGDISSTEKTLTTIQTEAAGTETKLMDAMDKLGVLDSQIDMLKLKRANNSLVALRAEETAATAHKKANDAKKQLDGVLMDKYRKVKDLVDHKAKGVQDARQKAEKLRDEAKQLLQDAQDKLKRLTDLEDQYMDNEKILEGKAKQLDVLEGKMKEILAAINQQIQIYNTCQ